MATTITRDGEPEPPIETAASSTPVATATRRREGRLARDLRRAAVDPATDGDEHGLAAGLAADVVDRVASFSSPILVIRWGTTALSLLLAAPQVIDRDAGVLAWCAVLVAYAVFRSLFPIRFTGGIASVLRVLAEVALHVGAVAATGAWDSPFVFSLLTAVIVAGFAQGFAFALRISAASALAVSIPDLVPADAGTEQLLHAAQWSAILLLVALVAGYGRRISGEADRQHTIALDRLGRLADANSLLYNLHRVAQTLPASLDMNEVLDTTVSRLRGLLDVDVIAIYLFDDTDAKWEVARQDGVRLPPRLGPTELPTGLRRAMAESAIVSLPHLGADDGEGVGERSRSGLYAVLPSRGTILGLLAVEHHEPRHFSRRDIEVLNGFAEPVALALDNARWFGRLRTVGADEERTRIARELHDRIGQSLAYLAFELDRLVGKESKGEVIHEPLTQLREDLRGVIGEVRETLYDLRADVSEQVSIADVIEQFVERVAERSELTPTVYCDRTHRLPILQEREMWRIAQEAVVNVERHSEATECRVIWRCDGERAALEVSDNGRGFEPGRAGRLDSYGMMGMRERASSIGAALEVHSAPGRGTRILCYLTTVQE